MRLHLLVSDILRADDSVSESAVHFITASYLLHMDVLVNVHKVLRIYVRTYRLSSLYDERPEDMDTTS